MGWREDLGLELEGVLADLHHNPQSDAVIMGTLRRVADALLADMPPADRIALARELLAGTDYGLIYRSPPRKCPCCGDASGFVHGFGDNDIPLLTCKACRAVGPEHSNDGWNACRAAMPGGEVMRAWGIDRLGYPYFMDMKLMERPVLRQILERMGARYEYNLCVWRL